MTWLEAPLNYWRSGGILLAPLSMVCFGIWFYFLRSRIHLMKETALATAAASALADDAAPAAGSLPQNLQPLCPYVARALAEDTPSAVQVFDEESARLVAGMRRDAGVLKALTIVAPLLGLLGTVVGMMATFDAVAGSDGDTARRVADGVSRALITTQVGLVIAIPGVFGQMHLRRLQRRFQVQLESLRLHVFEITVERLA